MKELDTLQLTHVTGMSVFHHQIDLSFLVSTPREREREGGGGERERDRQTDRQTDREEEEEENRRARKTTGGASVTWNVSDSLAVSLCR